MAPPEGPEVLATVAAPEGRPVVLTAERWAHRFRASRRGVERPYRAATVTRVPPARV